MQNKQGLVDSWNQTKAEGKLDGLTIEQRVAFHQNHFADWDRENHGPPPVWFPDPGLSGQTNLGRFMASLGLNSFEELKSFWQSNADLFWARTISELAIEFSTAPDSPVEYDDPRTPTWLPGGRLNIAASCFLAKPEQIAIRYRAAGEPMQELTYGELDRRVTRMAAWLARNGFQPGSRIAVVLPMHMESVVIYLAIVRAGCAVVSIADSFSSAEIAKRIRISQANAVVYCASWKLGNKTIELESRIREAVESDACEGLGTRTLELAELPLGAVAEDKVEFEAPVLPPEHTINVLFSSGTTGDPKAIPWDQTTPIKCAADGFFHHDIRPGDVVVWPTNTGWMMGPWLIFASLINKATIGLFEGSPIGKPFAEFVAEAGTTMLGVVPAIVRHWRQSGSLQGVDWSSIRCFSSTGEASNELDMTWLSASAGFQPIIEYCGGTEIGGGYISSTMLQPNVAAAFSTPAIGMDFRILDEQGTATDEGEIFLVPPSIGLSTKLLNRDHWQTYYADVPESGVPLRRHGDRFVELPGGYFRAGGRVDDTMNPGGIKIGSAEIESIVNDHADVSASAVIAVTVDKEGSSCPDRLILFVVRAVEGERSDSSDAGVAVRLKRELNTTVRRMINPLIRISELHFRDSLPRTASNKIMRRELRKEFLQNMNAEK